MEEPFYEVVWPLAKSAHELIRPAHRVQDLSGKTVCQLWNWCFKGDQIFGVLRDLLAERFPGVKFVDYGVFGKIDGVKEAEALAGTHLREQGCDLVLAGVGG